MEASKPVRNRLVVRLAATTAAMVLLTGGNAFGAFDVVEKTIPQLTAAYKNGQTTVSDVVQQYLARITKYDDGSRGVNAVGQINPQLTAAVTQAQALINSGASLSQYPMLGVPVLVKDSYDVAGMITTNAVSVLNGSGTPGSTTLIAPNDAPSVAALKAAGAIILGKTNLSTMAYSFNGIDNAHGVVRNPYNYNRQPGGSSSGSGAAAASNFAMVTMGGETGGSIRIPSTFNALVGLKTSAGLINPGGTWPLTASRDVVGPIAKSVTDVAIQMNALVQPTSTNLWNNTPFYKPTGPQPGAIGTGTGEGTDPSSPGFTAAIGTRPADYTAGLSINALQGKVIAVPNSVRGVGTQYDGTVNTRVAAKFNQALDTLRAQGATIKFVDVPSQSLYYNTLGRGTPTTTGLNDRYTGAPIAYPTTTSPTGVVSPSSTWSTYANAYYYQKQIEQYGDPTVKNLRDFATALYGGLPKDANGNPITSTANNAPAIVTPGAGDPNSNLIGAYNNINSLAQVWEAGNAKGFGDADGDGVLDNPEAQTALQAFTTIRQQYFNDFMEEQGIDAFVAPTVGSVAPLVSANLRDPGLGADIFSGGASLIGRFDANILGLPALTVPMGTVEGESSLWTGLQFFSQLDSEAKLLAYGYDYEQATLYRTAPDLARFIPEPASLAALSLGGFVFLRRRRQATVGGWTN